LPRQVEAVLPIGVDVARRCWRDAGELLVGDLLGFATELFDHLSYVHGVPAGDSGSDEVESVGLVSLGVRARPADLAELTNEDPPAKGVEGLALIELAADLPAVGGVRQVTKQEQRAHGPAVLDQGLGKWRTSPSLDHHIGACTAIRQASALEAAVSVMVVMM
jgi:hypothetical protein